MKKKRLWIRKLSCKHERPTNIAFIVRNYDKPKIGQWAYCRECCKEAKIIGVEEAKDSEVKALEKVVKNIQINRARKGEKE